MSYQNESSKKNEIIFEEQNNNKINTEDEEKYLIGSLLRESNFEEDKFISPTNKVKWQWESQSSYHFKKDIESIWLIVKNFEYLSILNNRGHYPCISIKGQDTWRVGNEFKGNLFGIFPFIARVEKCLNYPEIKKIKWLFHISYRDYILIKLELLKVTEDNTCVLSSILKVENVDSIDAIDNIFNCEKNKQLYSNIEKLLESKPINLFQYESGVINGKMSDIWNIVVDFNKLTAIAPNNNCLPNISIGNMKVGENVTTTVRKGGKIYELNISLQYKENRPGWNKWLFVFFISSDDPKNIPRHTILFQLTKISEDKCQLTFISKYHDSIDTNKFKDISNRKKYLLLSLKDYFDNFYSPNNSN